jgi:hypothetical protein
MKRFRIQFVSPMFIVGMVITLATVGTRGTVWGGTDVGNGMVGLVRGQTARLNTVNLGGPDTRPCEVELMFFDDQGNPLAARGIIIIGGKSDFLDLNADALGGPDTRPGDRFQIRAQVVIPPGPCRGTTIPTLEIFDNDTGKTTVFVGNPDE